jgi:hypothetical protein
MRVQKAAVVVAPTVVAASEAVSDGVATNDTVVADKFDAPGQATVLASPTVTTTTHSLQAWWQGLQVPERRLPPQAAQGVVAGQSVDAWLA